MKIYFFDNQKEAEQYGFTFENAKFDKFSVLAIAHKKKVMSVLFQKKGMFGGEYKVKPRQVALVIAEAVRQLGKSYPELYK